MNMPPNKITILRGYEHNACFTVIAESLGRELEVQDGLSFDEMLGIIARATCPTKDDGTPWRAIGRPLFLSPPTK